MTRKWNREFKPTSGSQSYPSIKAGRRGALKGVLAGGAAAGLAVGLPSAWTQPVVQAVMLPVHAQTTTPEPEIPADGSFNFAGELELASSGLLNWFVSRAHAQSNDCVVDDGCANLENGVFTVFLGAPCCCYTGSGSLGDTIDLTQHENCLDGDCDTPSVEFVELTETPPRMLTISIDGNEVMGIEDVGDCGCAGI